MNRTIKIPGLKDAIIIKVEQFKDWVAIYVEMAVKAHKCLIVEKKQRKSMITACKKTNI